MKIQFNYLNNNYPQQTFKASFAKDDETKTILRRAYYSAEDPTMLYRTIKALDNLKTNDTLSLKDTPNKTCVITNTRTGNSVEFSKESADFCTPPGQFVGVGLSLALYATIADKLHDLFEITTLKNKFGEKFDISAKEPLSSTYFQIGQLKAENKKLSSIIKTNKNDVTDLEESLNDDLSYVDTIEINARIKKLGQENVDCCSIIQENNLTIKRLRAQETRRKRDYIKSKIN